MIVFFLFHLFKDTSDIPYARVSSIFRKSMKKTKLTNKEFIQEGSIIRTLPLSKICEEDTENKIATEKQEMKDKHNDDTPVVAVHIVMCDNKVVGDTISEDEEL